MCVLKKMRAVAGALLLSPGLGMAAESGSVETGQQAAPAPGVSEVPQAMMMPSMQAWPQMMPYVGPPNYYWSPPPGMMWPMPPQYPVPMAMPPVPWMPVMWVLVPMPPGAPAGETADGKASLAASASANQSLPVTPVPPVSEQAVNYGPLSPAPVVKLPLPETAPAKLPAEGAVPVSGAAEAGKTSLDVMASAPEVVVTAVPGLPAVAEVASDVAAPIVSSMDGVDVDYGPVAPTPVVDLLALMQPATPSAPVRTKSRKTKKSSVTTPLKPRSTVTAKPVNKPAKQRMCWTKGIVAPCR